MTAVRSEEPLFLKHVMAIALSALTVITALVCTVFWFAMQGREENAKWVAHTYEVIGYIEQLSSSVKEAVIGERGYLLTGDEARLEPYYQALRDAPLVDAGARNLQLQRSIKQELAIIGEKTADNPIQHANLLEMTTAVNRLMDHLAKAIEMRKGSSLEEVRLEMPLAQGSSLLDEVRALVRVMRTEETNLLDLRLQTAHVSAQTNIRITLFVIVAFYIVLSFGVWLYLRNRETARQHILQYTQELEKREEELKMQQEELKVSNEEIEASNEELEEKTNALEEQNARGRQQTAELEEAKRLIEAKAREVETASKYKSEFLANMSHELRTPLNSLLILARSFAANEEGNLTPEQVEEAKVIYNGGHELLNLINDILDLSKVEAGKFNLSHEEIYIADIAKRMSLQFDPVARERGVDLKVVMEEGLPETMNTDAQRVEQILKNLLSNAFKFTEKGSVTLDIHTPGAGVELQRAALLGNDVIAFSVIDTGIGIEESKFRDIFEAFQQEDGSTERHYGGTGLGLTIARKFAHMLGGEIHVVSAKGRGSTFTLFLPRGNAGAQSVNGNAQRAVEYRASEPQPELKMPVESAARVFIPDDRKMIAPNDKVALIIEDDRSFAETLMKIARQRGYKCLVAGDGKAGLLLASDYPVSAIILDLRLPDMNGMNVLDQLKHALPTRHIPVHIISGVDPSQAAVPLRKGAVGYLTKPVNIEDINGAFTRMEGMSVNQVKKVLVIEDDKNAQIAINNLLRQKNVSIVMTGTGTEALGRLKKESFDCVILDLNLPDMTGFSWLEAMERETDGDTPVIVYTARELTEAENRELNRYTGSIVIKGASSSDRLLDEVTLFLHSLESTLSEDQRAMIRMNHDPDEALQNRTILLVDDDMRNTFALSKMLKKHGLNVLIADNGQLALEKLEEEPGVELVIMDIMMPVMDGYQAMQEIRNNPDLRHIPIIALTARAMPEEQERCMEAGANDYMTKPVDVDRLLTLLRVWLFRQEKAA